MSWELWLSQKGANSVHEWVHFQPDAVPGEAALCEGCAHLAIGIHDEEVSKVSDDIDADTEHLNFLTGGPEMIGAVSEHERPQPMQPFQRHPEILPDSCKNRDYEKIAWGKSTPRATPSSARGKNAFGVPVVELSIRQACDLLHLGGGETKLRIPTRPSSTTASLMLRSHFEPSGSICEYLYLDGGESTVKLTLPSRQPSIQETSPTCGNDGVNEDNA